jgi:hypothetical protein
MKRETSLFLTLGLLSAIAPPIFAQDLHGQPDPVPPIQVIGPQLIAWSELQQPRPIPQPGAEPRRIDGQPDQKPQQSAPSVQQPNQAGSTAGDQEQNKKRDGR